ncbi:MAG: 1-acyl-sn-glycerol-3-phosphate acyltransferase [Alphaproteobacteria bacterium]|nr:MAG: 1-acyl-sn-glycerol-3-phosphate acyltransferase [Alphaproteobacteria bacterium]
MVLIVLMTLALMPFQMLAIRFGWRLRSLLPLWYHRCALRIIGVRVRLHGRQSGVVPTLFVANHVSWVDIPVLGALIEGCFIAKREVGEWAGFGTLARLQRTIFVDRNQRNRAAAQNDEIGARLGTGENLILFAEGTSSDGNRVLPFKSALFGVAERFARAGHDPDGPGIMVQPVTIAYTAINGIPLTRTTRPKIGWYGDMAMLPHFTDLLGLGRIAVDIHFHDPVDSRAYASRKTLAAHCEREVRRGLIESKRRRDVASVDSRWRPGGGRRPKRRFSSGATDDIPGPKTSGR